MSKVNNIAFRTCRTISSMGHVYKDTIMGGISTSEEELNIFLSDDEKEQTYKKVVNVLNSYRS